MGHARQPPSLALVVLAVSLLAALGGGCGSSDETTEGGSTGGESATTSTAPAGAAAQSCAGAVGDIGRLRVTGVGCSPGRDVAVGWGKKSACRQPAGASRVSCSVEDYRCLGVATDRGVAVSCAKPGRSISFVAKHG
jgi:hypothetical protein